MRFAAASFPNRAGAAVLGGKKPQIRGNLFERPGEGE